MATLMTWGNSDGTKGRCDARCHDAKEPECSCMCQGRYHGIGQEQAVSLHTQDWFGVEHPTQEDVAKLAGRLKTAQVTGMPVRMKLW